MGPYASSLVAAMRSLCVCYPHFAEEEIVVRSEITRPHVSFKV